MSGGSGDPSGPDRHLDTNVQLYTAGVQYNLSPDWTLNANYSYSKSSRDRNESSCCLQNSAGECTKSRVYTQDGESIFRGVEFDGDV